MQGVWESMDRMIVETTRELRHVPCRDAASGSQVFRIHGVAGECPIMGFDRTNRERSRC